MICTPNTGHSVLGVHIMIELLLLFVDFFRMTCYN